MNQTPSFSTNQRLSYLKDKLALVPEKPGIYLHKGQKGDILYVGKAKNLLNRVRSYFVGLESHTGKTRALVENIYDFEVIVVDNEHESLLLEQNFIKHHKPQYNILLKDDKGYPYIKIDVQSPWPRVLPARQRKNDGNLYFGPYTSKGQVYQLLSFIHKYFPIVKCTPQVFKVTKRPCNYFDIKRCLGPCSLAVETSEYQKHIDTIIGLLSGKKKELIKNLKEKIQHYALELQYEKAAIFRDQLLAIEKIGDNQSVHLLPGIDLDMIGAAVTQQTISIYVAMIRDGCFIGCHTYIIKNNFPEPKDDNQSYADWEKEKISSQFLSFLFQYYQQKLAPKNIVFPFFAKYSDKDLLQFIEDSIIVFQANHSEFVPSDVGTLKFHTTLEDFLLSEFEKKQSQILKKKFIDLAQMCIDNAQLRADEQLQLESHSQLTLKALQDFLHLPYLPQRIECYDISTFQGSDTVASQVVFQDGRPSKKDYRKYIIKDVVGKADDFASLREVMRRRFKSSNQLPPPDLLVVDGGEPQIREVGWTLKALGVEHLALIGIAKSRVSREFKASHVSASQERIVIPERNSKGELLPDSPPITLFLKEGSQEYRLMTHLRNEAHRFAITFHKLRRDQSSMRSILSAIKGFGPKSRKKLLEKFSSYEEIMNTSEDVIFEKTGINKKLIIEIKNTLREKNSKKDKDGV